MMLQSLRLFQADKEQDLRKSCVTVMRGKENKVSISDASVKV